MLIVIVPIFDRNIYNAALSVHFRLMRDYFHPIYIVLRHMARDSYLCGDKKIAVTFFVSSSLFNRHVDFINVTRALWVFGHGLRHLLGGVRYFSGALLRFIL